jgi:hypothetical protein
MEERRVELLVGRRVYDPDSRSAGRLEEIRAERDGEHYVVVEYHIGPAALLERLALRHVGIRLPWMHPGYIARWDQLDLSDERRPTLLCPVEDLEPMPRRPRK